MHANAVAVHDLTRIQSCGLDTIRRSQPERFNVEHDGSRRHFIDRNVQQNSTLFFGCSAHRARHLLVNSFTPNHCDFLTSIFCGTPGYAIGYQSNEQQRICQVAYFHVVTARVAGGDLVGVHARNVK
ncbi:hypothetical protein [Paraburkholderia sp. RL17-373-BIF-A]|uniref:hypothetical protein n=1 Tax=Paraburkholderia sp. RL17-373-BIF-A TaxID=3031629 RepID=UPI0038BBDE77